ncbi:DUF1801 domain-containing protein [Brevundimonas sp. 2R-24]|uniref:DUF1801 domain-containing protein n=1 Tax=Peiella sedimenti TaxID=3061083 RepID=A0ABT8SPG2_9CAUL|nr:DUF1801 domain-containing protein [Caulobacteraceae bacterium XZ-24]
MSSQDVDDWFAAYDTPLKPLMQAVRRVVLEADPRIDEAVKWKAPTFVYRGNLASFNPRSKAHVSLVFHEGASIPGEFPNLVGEGSAARTMKFAGAWALAERADELTAVVRAWCDQRSGAAT